MKLSAEKPILFNVFSASRQNINVNRDIVLIMNHLKSNKIPYAHLIQCFWKSV